MPLYEFRCRRCETVFESLRPMGDTGQGLDCPDCGAARPERVLSTFATPSGTTSRTTADANCCGRPFT